MMEASEFIKLAEPDKSTTLDVIGNIIGPGYVPGFEADKTHIPAYEVECGDIDDIDVEQNDSSNDEEDFDKTIKLNKNFSKFA
nr:MAG TPA: glycoprotein repeat protein [Caudoviricetes sp.]